MGHGYFVYTANMQIIKRHTAADIVTHKEK